MDVETWLDSRCFKEMVAIRLGNILDISEVMNSGFYEVVLLRNLS